MSHNKNNIDFFKKTLAAFITDKNASVRMQLIKMGGNHWKKNKIAAMTSPRYSGAITRLTQNNN